MKRFVCGESSLKSNGVLKVIDSSGYRGGGKIQCSAGFLLG